MVEVRREYLDVKVDIEWWSATIILHGSARVYLINIGKRYSPQYVSRSQWQSSFRIRIDLWWAALQATTATPSVTTRPVRQISRLVGLIETLSQPILPFWSICNAYLQWNCRRRFWCSCAVLVDAEERNYKLLAPTMERFGPQRSVRTN